MKDKKDEVCSDQLNILARDFDKNCYAFLHWICATKTPNNETLENVTNQKTLEYKLLSQSNQQFCRRP